MDKTFVQDPENDVDSDDCRPDQVRLGCQGSFENFRGSLVERCKRGGLGERLFRILNRGNGLAQRMSWRKIELQRDRWKHILMVDRERRDRHIGFR